MYDDSLKKSQGYDFSYLIMKCGLLMIYYTFLEEFGLHTTNFKLHSFLVLTPLVKIWHFNKLQTKQDWIKFAYSIFNDYCHAIIYFKFFVPMLVGGLFSWFPILVSVVFIGFELLQHQILYRGDSYEILTTGRLEDNLLAPIVCTSFYIASRGVDFVNSGMGEAKSFLVFCFLMFVFDASFGINHYLEHNVKSLWGRHILHHQYKKEKINAFANFYSEFWDSIIMNCSLAVTAIALVICFGRYHISFMDVIFAAASSHLRYGENQMSLMFFFEWDLIDMALKRNRIGSYHANHHHDSNINYSVYGIVSDDMIKSIMPRFEGKSIQPKAE